MLEISKSAVLAIGVFDGVHTGHRLIVKTLAELAAKLGATGVVMSFAPHPRCVVSPAGGPPLLMPPTARAAMLKACGADEVIIKEFTRGFARLTPEAFLESVLKLDGRRLAGIVVGEHWRFGFRGSGGGEELARFASAHGMEFVPVPEVVIDGLPVSSSRIRRAMEVGDLALAGRLLGRRAELYGRVGHGLKVASSELGRPTANLEVECGVLPPDGVYACRACTSRGAYPAAVNVGVAPTVKGQTRGVEAHLLDFEGDLYGEEIKLEIAKFIRGERKFSSLAELKTQIAADVELIKEMTPQL